MYLGKQFQRKGELCQPDFDYRSRKKTESKQCGNSIRSRLKLDSAMKIILDVADEQ